MLENVRHYYKIPKCYGEECPAICRKQNRPKFVVLLVIYTNSEGILVFTLVKHIDCLQ